MKVPKHRRSVTTIKSIHSAGISSVPKTQRTSYLELYALGREKSRLRKEMLVVEARRETIGRYLGSINERIVKLQREMMEEQQAETGEKTPRPSIRTVDINY